MENENKKENERDIRKARKEEWKKERCKEINLGNEKEKKSKKNKA